MRKSNAIFLKIAAVILLSLSLVVFGGCKRKTEKTPESTAGATAAPTGSASPTNKGPGTTPPPPPPPAPTPPPIQHQDPPPPAVPTKTITKNVVIINDVAPVYPFVAAIPVYDPFPVTVIPVCNWCGCVGFDLCSGDSESQDNRTAPPEETPGDFHQNITKWAWKFKNVMQLGENDKRCKVELARYKNPVEISDTETFDSGTDRDPIIPCKDLKRILNPQDRCHEIVESLKINTEIIAANFPEAYDEFTRLYYNLNGAEPVRFHSDKRVAQNALNELIKDCGSE